MVKTTDAVENTIEKKAGAKKSIFSRRNGDTPRPGPVWQLGKELSSEKYRPSSEELAALKTQLNIELDKLLL